MVRVNDIETASALLRAGADPKLVTRYGVTPMSLAVANGNAAMIKLLLEAGADANAPDAPATRR
jgi:ankyrin repeat protein